MQNCTFLVLLRPIFVEKMKTAPPPKEIGCRSCEVDVVIRPEKAFEYPLPAEKSVSISVKTFFFRSPVFGLKKRLNFRVFREIPSQFSDKPCGSDSRTMKIRVKVVCSFLTLSKDPPPFSNPGYAPGCNTVVQDASVPRKYKVSIVKKNCSRVTTSR